MIGVSLVTKLAACVGILTGVLILFEKAEDNVKLKTKRAISRWLLNLDPPGAVAGWPATFEGVFDSVFGERLISWRCFRRSCVASLVSVIIVTLVWGAMHPRDFRTLFLVGVTPLRMGFFSIAFIIANLIPDYISLVESRLVIRLMRRGTSWISTTAYLLLDVGLTALIASVGVRGIVELIVLYFYALLYRIVTYSAVQDWIVGLTFSYQNLAHFFSGVLTFYYSHWIFPPFGIFFYSAFFTSVWVWLYALSGATVKLANYLGLGLTHLRTVLDIENKPLRCIGLVTDGLILCFLSIQYFLSVMF